MKYRILLPFLLGLFFLSNTSLAQAEGPESLFYAGTAAYAQGHLDEAAKNFETYLDRHPNDARSHLNLTTIFAKQKKWGLAWAHFRKTQALNPHLDGLSVLRTLLEENPEPPGLSGPFYRWARPFLASVAPSVLLFILLVCITGLGHVLITHLKQRKWARETEEPPPPLSMAFWASLTLGLISCGCLFGRMYLSSETFGAVTQSPASLFSAPTQEGFEVGTLPAGAELKVLRKKPEWIQVTNESGISGWMKADSLLTYPGAPQ